MNTAAFDRLVDFAVRTDLLGPTGSFALFRPELILCATILVILLAQTILPRWKQSAYVVTLVGLCTAMYFAVAWHFAPGPIPESTPIFSGVLLSDSFTIVLRSLLLLFAILFVTFTQLTAATDGPRDNMTEFFVLMLGALLGMCLMIAANHVVIVLLGVEMASVPCYVLAGMKRNQTKSSEASLKYAVFGAGAAGVMLYGLSLLSGVLGSAHLPTMTIRLAEMMHHGLTAEQATVLTLGGLMLGVGVAFKLSAVPFHFWAPDVFEGATAEVAAFLSIASKAAALGLLVRLATGFAFQADPSMSAALAPVRQGIGFVIALMAAVTCTFGNLAAYGQTNMKRLLAYSTIAHAGYMMMPVAAAVVLLGRSDVADARSAVAALIVYIGIYLFMNLAAFAIVAFLRNAIHSEEIADYAGLVRTSPGLTVCMAIVMFSLVGLPPLAGFQGKFVIFGSLIQANLYALLLVGVLNTVFSLFYYLRVVRVMALSPPPLHREPPLIPLSSLVGSYCALLTVPLVALFFLVGGLLNWAAAAASTLFY
ncbi:MAG: NADH-quinone oxidoreductase subunit N [Thermoguttaceae bacterium]